MTKKKGELKKPEHQPPKLLENPAKEEKTKGEKTKDNQDEAFDFGGLPLRDMKKNLGCG